MSGVHSKTARVLFPLLTTTLLATACGDEATAPQTGGEALPDPTSPALAEAPRAASASGALPQISAGAVAAAQGEGEVVPGQYIVVFKREVFRNRLTDAPLLANKLIQAHGGRLRYVFGPPHEAFVVSNLPDQAVNALARNLDVGSIQADRFVTTHGVQSMPTGQPWGLDRIDQRSRALTRTYGYTHTGKGVHAYILDTGLDYRHPDFGGRARVDYDVFGGYANGKYIGYGADCAGHGTHVAGTVGGATSGVAKSVRLHGVKVIHGRTWDDKSCGTGTMTDVAWGLYWVYLNRINPAVVNMSLGLKNAGPDDSYVDAWVNTLANDGVFVAVSAGNDTQRACLNSPARVPSAFTTAASTWNDTRRQDSNYGSCVDAYAPGDQITSAWPGGKWHTIGGTSMASPHIAGVAALYKQAYGNASSATITNWIKRNATANVVGNSPTGTPNLLLFKGGL
jgi:subtilisin family serine protease